MRKPSAALVVACAALVMSTIGTSLAATHYVITSPKQVKPGSISLAALSKKRAQGAARRAWAAWAHGRDRCHGRDGRSRACGPERHEALGADRRRRHRQRLEPGRDGPGRRLARHLRHQLRPGHHALRSRRHAGIDSDVHGARLDSGRRRGRTARVALQRRQAIWRPASRARRRFSSTRQARRGAGAAIPSSFSIAIFC